MEEKKLVCPNCECEIKEDDDFCPDCGTLFAEDVKCAAHEDKNAEGVCVICCEPFCKECGSFIDDVFFCEEDSDYKFSEGRVNLFESNDSEQMDIVKNILEEKGLHPLIIFPKGGLEFRGLYVLRRIAKGNKLAVLVQAQLFFDFPSSSFISLPKNIKLLFV